MDIDWNEVNKRLVCPICGGKAHIEAGTDGYEASHTHRFQVTREHAMKLTQDAAKERIAELERELAELRAIK